MTAILSAMLATAPQHGYPQSSEYERAQIVVARNLLMHDLQTAYFNLFKVKNKKSDDYQSAADTARSMPDIMDEFLLLLPPETAKGEAPGSRVKPEVWTDASAFATAAELLKAQALALAEIADSGDSEAYSVAFGLLTEACTGCHGLRPSSGGAFRFAVDE
ncbi:cytochrome c [Tropicimonas sp. IMCC6043]|uniref:cytochrome c n=1 Tax=Tropicimonas sp. IMCC6043 TaxID=2510645 RepID=UPI0013EC36CB|nr:cytochrome c [Tropicimonas sp. IMCC6043]